MTEDYQVDDKPDWDGDSRVVQSPSSYPVMESSPQQLCLAALLPPKGTAISQCPTNIDVRTLRGRAMLVKAGSPGDYEVRDGAPLRLVATHWLVMPDTVDRQETGEVADVTRVVLYDAAGKTFRTTGVGSVPTLLRLLQAYTRQEWAGGIPLVVVSRPSKRYRGATYQDIQVDLEGMGV